MKFSCVASDIHETLKIISKVIPAISSVNIECDKTIKIIGSASGSYLSFIIKGKVEKSGKCTVPFKELEGVVKGRKQSSFQEKNGFNCVSGRYNATIPTSPLEEITKPKAENGLKFDEKMQSSLVSMISACSISDTDSESKPPLVVAFGSESTSVACFTRIHGIICTNKNLKLKDKIVYIPQEAFSNLQAASRKKAFRLTFDDTSMIAFNEEMLVAIPIYVDVQFKWELIKAQAKEFSTSEKEVVIKSEDLKKTLENIMPFYEKRSAINVSAGKNEITMTVSNGSSEVKDVVPCKGTFTDLKINPKLIQEVISKCSGDLDMFFKSGCLGFRYKEKDCKYTMFCMSKR